MNKLKENSNKNAFKKSVLEIDSIVKILSTAFFKFKTFFIFLFCCLMLYVFYRSGFNALGSSQDMQWYPSTLFWNGINPYSEYLTNKDNWFLSQAPNYGHLLYIVLYPISLLEWETAKIVWMFINYSAFIGIIFLFSKSGISLPFLLFVTIFLLIGYPVGNTIGNGQIGIIIGFFVALAWYNRNSKPLITVLALSFVFVKYSFGLPILFGFFLAGYRKEVVYAVLINLIAAVAYSFLFNIVFTESFLLPFKVAMIATGIGPIDFMSLERILLSGGAINFKFSYLLVPSIFIFFGVLVFKFKKYLNDSDIVSMTIFLSLVTFFHLGYDHVMFLIAILILKQNINSRNIFLIAFTLLSIALWNCGRIVSKLDTDLMCSMNMGVAYTSIVSLTVCALVVLYILNQSIHKHKYNPL